MESLPCINVNAGNGNSTTSARQMNEHNPNPNHMQTMFMQHQQQQQQLQLSAFAFNQLQFEPRNFMPPNAYNNNSDCFNDKDLAEGDHVSLHHHVNQCSSSLISPSVGAANYMHANFGGCPQTAAARASMLPDISPATAHSFDDDDFHSALNTNADMSNITNDARNLNSLWSSSGKLKVKVRRKLREPRFCFQTRSDVDVLDDGYKWRKYGQKVVKNSLHPRSYYRCTHNNCRVKKRVERLSEDCRMVITTYEGRHTHSPCDDTQSNENDFLKTF